ncbi:MAG: hypothetical protein U5K75_05330 [Ahrensia sp.]|nr:hypothetical protein [Ahrensia sp.]
MTTPITAPIEHHVVDGKIDPAANYSKLSLAVHWFSGLGILILVLTQFFGWTSAHTSFGLLLALPLIARVIYRWSSGFPRAHDQHPSISLIERLIIIALLICMFTLALSGLLLPLFQGAAYSIFGLLSWPAPYEGNADITVAFWRAFTAYRPMACSCFSACIWPRSSGIW